jgi:hypothetical protein
LHIIEGIGLLLNVPVVGIAGVEDLGSWRWGLKLRLPSLIIVIVVLALVVDFVVNVLDRVCEWVQVFGGVFFAHEGVVLALLESHLDGDAAAVQVCLAV